MFIIRTKMPNHSQIQHRFHLLISYVNPHQPVSKATVARWIKEVLRVSGIDTKTFTAYSCPTSSDKVVGLNLREILKSARLSNTQTFTEFYDKRISNLSQYFGNKLLESFNKQPI